MFIKKQITALLFQQHKKEKGKYKGKYRGKYRKILRAPSFYIIFS